MYGDPLEEEAWQEILNYPLKSTGCFGIYLSPDSFVTFPGVQKLAVL